MRVVILAAGYGTRLYPLTLNLPKSFLAINNKPIINFLIDKLENLKISYPISEIKIVSNNKFFSNFLEWKDKYQIKAEIINDGSNSPDDRLGAVKDIKFAINKKDDWLVIGGDNLFKDDFKEFLEFSYKNKPYPSIGLYELGDKNLACGYGVARINSENKVLDFEEKPVAPLSTLAATCLYFFPRQSLVYLDNFLEDEGGADTCGEYIRWLSKKNIVYGYVFKNKWFDIGSRTSLEEARQVFL